MGAHKGEESTIYKQLGLRFVDWVEAQPAACRMLEQTLPVPNHRVFQLVAWSKSGVEMIFNVTNNSQSSSLLQLKSHSEHYPGVFVEETYSVKTCRLDEALGSERYFLVNLDVQGAELEVLKGMGDLIDEVSVVYMEVNREELYEGCALIDELDEWFLDRGFSRTITKWTRKGWGDAIFTRETSQIRLWAARFAFHASELLGSRFAKLIGQKVRL